MEIQHTHNLTQYSRREGRTLFCFVRPPSTGSKNWREPIPLKPITFRTAREAEEFKRKFDA